VPRPAIGHEQEKRYYSTANQPPFRPTAQTWHANSAKIRPKNRTFANGFGSIMGNDKKNGQYSHVAPFPIREYHPYSQGPVKAQSIRFQSAAKTPHFRRKQKRCSNLTLAATLAPV